MARARNCLQCAFQAASHCSPLVHAPLQAPMVAVGEGDPGVVVATLRQALEALSRLSNERASLEEALKVRRCSARDSVM